MEQSTSPEADGIYREGTVLRTVVDGKTESISKVGPLEREMDRAVARRGGPTAAELRAQIERIHGASEPNPAFLEMVALAGRSESRGRSSMIERCWGMGV